jgi:hypothetical protein
MLFGGIMAPRRAGLQGHRSGANRAAGHLQLEHFGVSRDDAAMHNADTTLSDTSPAPTATLPTRELLEAIARRLCVSCVYNKTEVTLAPQIVYTKHDELFVDAVPVERDRKPPRELKLGTFKLAGLNDTAITSRHFDRFNGFDPKDEKYAGVTIFAIEG